MDNIVKFTSIHIITAIIAALLSTSLSLGWFGIKNDFFGGLIALIILYITGQLSQKKFSEDIEGFSGWLWSGIFPFFFTWVILYTILFNYL